MKTEHLTTHQLAKRLHKQPQTIRFWRMAGRGPRYIRLGGIKGRVVYRLEDIEEWELQRTFNNTSEESAAAEKGAPGLENEAV